MADESWVDVKLRAITQPLTDGLNSASGQIKGFAGGVQGTFNGIGGAIGSIQGPLMALGGVLAGGAMFKSAMDATMKWNGEAIKLARTLGISTEQASVLNVALGDIYTDAETYTSAVNKMTMQLNRGGESFKKLGVETRDSKGQLKDSNTLMLETIEKLNGIEQGTKRNAAGLSVFGKGWNDAQKLLKLNSQVMQEAKEKAEKLNMVVGGDAVEAHAKFKAAQNDMEDGLLAMKLTVGNEVTPVFTDLMIMFADVLPPVIKTLSYIVKGLVTAWETLKFAIKAVAQMVGAVFGSIMDSATAIGSAIVNLLKGNFKEAAADAKNAAGAIKNNFSAAFEGIGQDYDKLGQKMVDTWDKGPAKASGNTRVGKQGTSDFDPEKQNGMKKWESELAQMKARVIDMTSGFSQLGEESELEFWTGKLAATRKGTEEYTKILEKMNALKISLASKEIDDQKANDEKFWALYQIKADETQSREMNDLELRRVAFEQKLALGQVSGERELEQKRKFAKDEEAITLKRLEVELAAAGDDEVRRTQIQNRMLEVQRKTSQDITKLNTQAATTTAKAWQDSFARMGTAFGNAVGGILTKTMTLQQAMGMMLKAALKELLMYVMKVIAAKGAEAGAGAAASAAQTPVVGWAMAIPAMTAVLAAVLGLGATVGSAAGGWDIPAGVNPMGQLHAEEMVLPAKYANLIRDMADGKSSGPQSAGPQVVFHIQAMDSRSVERFFNEHGPMIANVVQGQARDYNLRRI